MSNPNGKKGSQKHQDVQKKEFEKAQQEFKTQSETVKVDKEVSVSTPNGKKKSRVADVAVFSKKSPLKFLKIIQIGKTDKNGKPVVREQEAIEDIESHYDINVDFIDYKKYNL